MNDFRREICNDCVHGKIDGGNVTCTLTNCKPAFAVSCVDFCANDKQHSRYLATQQTRIDELNEEAEKYISVGGTLSVLILVVAPLITHFAGSFMYIYIGAFLTIAILAYAIFKYVQAVKMRSVVEYELYKYKLVHADAIHEVQTPPSAPITYIHIMHILRQLGYTPYEMGKEGSEEWIRILYGDVYMYILYREGILKVLCPFGHDDVAQDGQSVFNFLLAANAVMAQNRFVQITGHEEGYHFLVSGYVKTHEELCDYLPNYLGIINDSIVTHRRYLHHYTAQSNSDTTEQTPTNNTTVN